MRYYIALFLMLAGFVSGIQVENGATDVITHFDMRDQTAGTMDTGITVANLEMYYIEDQASMSADVFVGALATPTTAHTDGRCIHIGRGRYRVDWPDAAFDGGVGKRVQLILVDGDGGAFEETLEVELSPPGNVTQLDGSDVQQTGGHIHAFDDAGAALSTLTTSDNIGINWGDVSNPTTSVGLSNTTIGTTTVNTDMVGEPSTALAAIKLDHLINIAVDTNYQTTVHADSVIGYMTTSSATADYVRTTDSLEDLRDRGDAAWVTATGFATSGEPLTAQEVEDAVWDTLLTGALHNNATSAGKRLRQIEGVTVLREEEQAQGGTASTITMHTDASSINGFYDDVQIIIVGDLGIGQSRHIHAYVGSTRVASITPDWITAPDATSDYVLLADSEKHVHEIDTDAVNAATVADSAWQELIELIFDFDATATYATANAGSVVKQIADNAASGGATAQQVWEYNISAISTAGYAGTIANAILADTGDLQTNQGAFATATGFSTHNAAAVWAVVMENSKSYAQVMRVIAAVLSGKSSAAAGQMSFVGIDGTTTRLTVTVSSGARTSVDTWDGD